MKKKKNIGKIDIITKYIDYVLTDGQDPKSIYKFSKDNDFEEQQFYKHFASFESLKKDIFKTFFENTIKTLQKSEDYQNFEARDKLLSFYYTFFEILTVNRSYVVYALEGYKGDLKYLKTLSRLKKSFTDYVSNLKIKTLDLKREEFEKIQQKGLNASAWLQLLITLRFWLDDTSACFEKTDIFIEKSVKASFDLIEVTPIKSVIDFGKFLFKEAL